METIARVFAYSKRYPILLLAGLACTIASVLMVIAFPAALKYIIDDVIRGHRPERLLPLLSLLGLAIFVQIGLIYLRLLIGNSLEQKVIFDLRSDVYSHIQTLPVRRFDNRATGDLMTRILEGVAAVRCLHEGPAMFLLTRIRCRFSGNSRHRVRRAQPKSA
jgi:ATP-binding cassette subfamily B protein